MVVFEASKYNTNPLVTILGPVFVGMYFLAFSLYIKKILLS